MSPGSPGEVIHRFSDRSCIDRSRMLRRSGRQEDVLAQVPTQICLAYDVCLFLVVFLTELEM